MKGFLAFLAAGIIAGDVRFYSPDPMSSPFAAQVVSGICSDVPNIDDIKRSHTFIAPGFGTYVRRMEAAQSCESDLIDLMDKKNIVAEIQGFDPTAGTDAPPINDWLHLEYDMITLAAGWHGNLTEDSDSKPRPPLCHYP